MSAKRCAVRELLQVVEPARDALVAVRIERVEVHARSADDPGVELRGIKDRLAVCVDHTRLGGGVRVHEVGVLVSLVTLALLVTVTQRSLDVLQRGYKLAAAPQLGLRCCEVGISIRDLDLLTIGVVLDMWTEKSNDSVKYRRIAEQADFDLF